MKLYTSKLVAISLRSVASSHKRLVKSLIMYIVVMESPMGAGGPKPNGWALVGPPHFRTLALDRLPHVER